MGRRRQAGFTFVELLIVVAIIVIVGVSLATPFITQYLWNWLMPALFGLKVITAWQALGLMTLALIFTNPNILLIWVVQGFDFLITKLKEI